MAGMTNRGKYMLLGWPFVAATIPTNFFLALLTSATTPDADTNLMSDHTQIAVGNGYLDGGYSLTPGGTDFDVWTEDDGNDRGFVQIKDIVWTATGGPLPITGNGARWAVLTKDGAVVADREIYDYFDLVSDRSVSQDQTLTLEDCEIRINES